jgi:hypothetical protein
MVRHDNYNIWSAPTRLALQGLVALGHWVGLHHVVEPGDDPDRAVDVIRHDARMLAEVTGAEVSAFSIHNPGLTDSFGLVVPGLVNAYAAPYFADITYLSDSNLRWPQGEPDQALINDPNGCFQILAHPFHYRAHHRSDRDALLDFLALRTAELLAENSADIASFVGDPVTLGEIGRYLEELDRG